jgi:hypothetical protein
MPLGTPIQFTLYGDDDEIIKTYSRARVPVMFAERAIELSTSLTGDSMGQEQLMALYQIVVDFYGGQFTVEDLRKGADLGELIAVIESISTRAVELMPVRSNPTPPGK